MEASFKMTKLPNKISPCPIIEATVELKFNSSLPKGAVFGVIYNAVKEKFGTVEKLPTAMLPSHVLENDPNLQYKALYKLTDGYFNAQVGYDVVSLHSPSSYVGWVSFSDNIVSFFEKINRSGAVNKPVSLVLRYLNFFEVDIFKNINLQVQMFNEPYTGDNLVMRTEFFKEGFTNVLQLANNIKVEGAIGQKQGSLIDIICALHEPENLFNNIRDIINNAHQFEKELFFKLLKNEFLDSLQPEYDEYN